MVQISRCIINRLVSVHLVGGVWNKPDWSSDNTILYQRLEQRNYTRQKIEENVQCEIMKVIAEEARVSYKEDVVVYLKD